jgi:hypothetical protein
MSDQDEYSDKANHKEPQPWWNDGDKVGGLVATIVLLTLVILVCIVLIGFSIKLMFG